jgi:hypothetical protein
MSSAHTEHAHPAVPTATIETMEVLVHGGPKFHSVATPKAYGGALTLVSAEPADEDGSGEGGCF